MSSKYKHSEACCKTAPIVASGYELKGKYTEVGGMKCYVTGPADAKTAIFDFYDIMGYKDQILQIYILSSSNPKHPYLVVMPDFWDGKPSELEWMLDPTPENQAKLGKWMEGINPAVHIPKVKPIIDEFPNVESWGMIGYCWGGKMVSLLAGDGSFPFKAGIQTSPALIDVKDAERVRIPMCMLASNEEPVDDVKGYEEKLKVPKHVEIFEKVVHGFMSARADFDDETKKGEYERGYKIANQFFCDHL